jgi:hypothetical protein
VAQEEPEAKKAKTEEGERGCWLLRWLQAWLSAALGRWSRRAGAGAELALLPAHARRLLLRWRHSSGRGILRRPPARAC